MQFDEKISFWYRKRKLYLYLPLDEESLEDSDNETLAAEAKEVVVCWLGMCGEADRLRGLGVATEMIIRNKNSVKIHSRFFDFQKFQFCILFEENV